MKARYQQPVPKVQLSRTAMAKFMVRADVEDEFQKKVAEQEKKWGDKLAAYASTVDATMLYAAHLSEGYGAKKLRRLWETMIRTRIEFRAFYREGDTPYEERKTGDNAEDYALRDALRRIGVDIKAWEAEEIRINEETGEVTFHPPKGETTE